MAMVPHAGVGMRAAKSEELGMCMRLCRLLWWGIPGGINNGPEMNEPPQEKEPEDARKDKMDNSHPQAPLQELA